MLISQKSNAWIATFIKHAYSGKSTLNIWYFLYENNVLKLFVWTACIINATLFITNNLNINGLHNIDWQSLFNNCENEQRVQYVVTFDNRLQLVVQLLTANFFTLQWIFLWGPLAVALLLPKQPFYYMYIWRSIPVWRAHVNNKSNRYCHLFIFNSIAAVEWKF